MSGDENWYNSTVTHVKNALNNVYAKKTDLDNKVDKTNGANQITDTTSTLNNLEDLSDFKQSTINQAINNMFGTIEVLPVDVVYTNGDSEQLYLFKQKD